MRRDVRKNNATALVESRVYLNPPESAVEERDMFARRCLKDSEQV
jgi:hypothetical protein